MVLGDNHAKILNNVFLEETLLGFRIQVIGSKSFQHFSHNLSMLSLVITEDENIVQVHNDLAVLYKITKDGVHHGLKGCRSVAKAKVHAIRLEQTTLCDKRCLPLVTLFNADVIVPPPKVELREYGSM